MTGQQQAKPKRVPLPMPAPLPPTINGMHLSLPIIWPQRGVWRVWLVDGATELAIDAEQLVRFLGLEHSEPSFLVDHPLTWWHRTGVPVADGADFQLLWSRSAALAVAASVRYEQEGILAREFEAWLSFQHQGLCVDDPQATLDEILPVHRGASGEEFPIASAAKRLSVRYGTNVSRALLVNLMVDFGWIDRVDHDPGSGPLRTTARGRDRAFVLSRQVRTPKGRYEQVLITQAGLGELAAALRDKLLVDLVALADAGGES